MPRIDFWPTSDQELLLTAALADGASAIGAWDNWQARVSIAAADHGSRRLMPLVFFNLSRLGFSGASVAPLKEIYTRTRLANKLRFMHLGRLLDLFAGREIPTLLLKGAALALQTYRDPGLRPMNDLDLAVPHRFSKQAISVLQENGWLSETLAGSIRPAFCGSLQFRDAHGLQFDLHFSPFHDYAPFFRKRLAWESVEPLWAAATSISVGECKTLTLSATDQLLHTLDHGAGAHRLPPIRWVADATWLLRGSEPIEWDRFTAQAGALNLSWVASKTLKYLRDRHGATVPSSILKYLGRNVSALEMLEYSSRKNRLPRWIALRKCWAYTQGSIRIDQHRHCCLGL
jgi:Uncharacterised nucleotidyltransferase